MMRSSLVATFFLVACGGGDGGGGVDGGADAPATTVMVVDPCPATPDATVTTDDSSFAYMPQMTTITQGQVVKFVTSSTHDVKPNTLQNTDAGLIVGFSQTKCLRFTATGTFGFKCSIHAFTGTIQVN
jgi:plastocyanin